jgi:drug/metabolite transporter (DMT)-like permease
VIAHFALHDDKLTWLRALGIAAGFAGVVIILLRDVGGGSSTFWGYATQLIGSLLYGAATVFARRTLQGVSVILQALIPIAFADALLWIIVPFVEFPLAFPNTPLVIGAMLFLGLVCSCFAYLFYYYLIHSIGPTRTSMIAYIFPLVGVALGVLFLNELIDLRLVIGAALVLGSVFIVNRA